MPQSTPPVYRESRNCCDIESLGILDLTIRLGTEGTPIAQRHGDTESEPRTHVFPRTDVDSHFTVLRGWIGGVIDDTLISEKRTGTIPAAGALGHTLLDKAKHLGAGLRPGVS